MYRWQTEGVNVCSRYSHPWEQRPSTTREFLDLVRVRMSSVSYQGLKEVNKLFIDSRRWSTVHDKIQDLCVVTCWDSVTGVSPVQGQLFYFLITHCDMKLVTFLGGSHSSSCPFTRSYLRVKVGGTPRPPLYSWSDRGLSLLGWKWSPFFVVSSPSCTFYLLTKCKTNLWNSTYFTTWILLQSHAVRVVSSLIIGSVNLDGLTDTVLNKPQPEWIIDDRGSLIAGVVSVLKPEMLLDKTKSILGEQGLRNPETNVKIRLFL